ncbi:MAG TPA: YIP1 family protein [archaeon]|nr:YIP1 family protein [archaeon]
MSNIFIEVFARKNIDYLIEKKNGIWKILLIFYLITIAILILPLWIHGTLGLAQGNVWFKSSDFLPYLIGQPTLFVLLNLLVAFVFLSIQFIAAKMYGGSAHFLEFLPKSLFIFTLPFLGSALNFAVRSLTNSTGIDPHPLQNFIPLLSTFSDILSVASILFLIYALYLHIKFTKSLMNLTTIQSIISVATPIILTIILILISVFLSSLGGFAIGRH